MSIEEEPPPEVTAAIEEMRRKPPLSVGCGNPATFRAGEPASSGQEERALAQIKELLETLPAPTGSLLARIYEIASDGAPTTPPGEQGKGGGEGLPAPYIGTPGRTGCHPEGCPMPGLHTITSCNWVRQQFHRYGRHLQGCTRNGDDCSCGLLQMLAGRPLASTFVAHSAPAQPAEHPASGGGSVQRNSGA